MTINNVAKYILHIRAIPGQYKSRFAKVIFEGSGISEIQVEASHVVPIGKGKTRAARRRPAIMVLRNKPGLTLPAFEQVVAGSALPPQLTLTAI